MIVADVHNHTNASHGKASVGEMYAAAKDRGLAVYGFSEHNDMNKPFTAYALDAETMARWEHIIEVRTAVNGALEEARAAKVIGKSLEADVHLTVPEGDVFLADENPAALADLFIVSKVELTVGGELAVKVENAAGTKCPRCWKHSLTPNAEGLCPRCAEVVRHLPDLL